VVDERAVIRGNATQPLELFLSQSPPLQTLPHHLRRLDLRYRVAAPAVGDFNASATMPFGVTHEHVHQAMVEFTEFLGFVNTSLNTKGIRRLESMLMPANFSSMVGEFAGEAIPKYAKGVVRNRYHNGHPDLIEAGRHQGDAVQHYHEGIEIKASRYKKGWQGHNPEDTWLMVFVFDASRPTDVAKDIAPKPFSYLAVFGAELSKSDWTFSGRKGGSRRTITASVNRSGYAKMSQNWIYKAPGFD
jgi:hypothetical protein